MTSPWLITSVILFGWFCVWYHEPKSGVTHFTGPVTSEPETPRPRRISTDSEEKTQ